MTDELETVTQSAARDAADAVLCSCKYCEQWERCVKDRGGEVKQ